MALATRGGCVASSDSGHTDAFPPEFVHNGGKLEPFVHQMAAPNIMEMETIPELRAATPGWNRNIPLTEPDVKKKQPMQRMMKKPAQAKKMGMKKKTSVVMKKPSGKALVKIGVAVVKKPAKSTSA